MSMRVWERAVTASLRITRRPAEIIRVFADSPSDMAREGLQSSSLTAERTVWRNGVL